MQKYNFFSILCYVMTKTIVYHGIFNNSMPNLEHNSIQVMSPHDNNLWFLWKAKKWLRTSIFWIAFVIIVRFQRKDFGIFVGFQQKRNVILITAVSLKSRQIRFMAECIRLTQQHLLGFADAIITGRSKTLTFFATKYWAENINISWLRQCATLFIYACTRDLIFKYLSLA